MEPDQASTTARTTIFPARGRRFAAAAFLLAAGGLLAAMGCADEPGRIRIRIGTGAEVPVVVNRVRVSVAASRGPVTAPQLCVPWVETFLLEHSSDLPFYVDFLPGPEYPARVFVRVEYLRFDGTTEIPVGLRDTWLDPPESGTREISMELDVECVGRGCPAGAPQCINHGECVVATDVLDNPGLIVDGGPSCQTLDEPDGG
jgi:hypothetical protein